MAEGLHQWFVQTDFRLWYYLHHAWRADWLDTLMPFVRNQYFWAPLYLFLLVFMAVNFRKRGWLWCLGFILCFALADYISASIIKPWLHRTRPCNDPRLAHLLQLIVPRSYGYSFPSSHAANHFAMGTYSAVTLHRCVRGIWIPFILWALLIAYAQVYVGVHFPFDVLFGGLLGTAIGLFVAKFYHHRFRLEEAL